MIFPTLRKVLFVAVSMALTGCASVNTAREYETARESAIRITGHPIRWEQSPHDKSLTGAEVDRMMEDGLSMQEAVRIALINNRTLQAELERMGISKADLVQAALPSNPRVGAVFRFLLGGGQSAFEGEGFLPIADIWQIPFRRRVAQARLEFTMEGIRLETLQTAAKARNAFIVLYYLEEASGETLKLVDQFRRIAERVEVRRDFGFLTDQDVFLAKIMLFRAKIELSGMKKETQRARLKLNRVLGFNPSRSDYFLIPPKPPDLSKPPQPEEMLKRALENRPDVRMARIRVRQAKRILSLQKARIWKVLDMGAGFEKEAEGEFLLGPAVDVQLPLFDQNTAQVARAKHVLRRSQRFLEALELSIREEVLSDISEIRYQAQRLQLILEDIIPLRKKVLKFTEQWVGAMELNRLHLLDAQRGLLETGRELLDARRALHEAWTDLWLNTGGGDLADPYK
jgi:cobalt-zinc-cadmium efflux system outer membrane protein